MKDFFVDIMKHVLSFFGMEVTEGRTDIIAEFLVSMLIAVAIGLLLYMFLWLVSKLLSNSHDNSGVKYVFKTKSLRRVAFFVAVTLFYIIVPLSDVGDDKLVADLKNFSECILVVAWVSMFVTFFKVVFEILDRRKCLHNRPLKAAMQLVTIIAYIVGTILIVSILLDKSPVRLLTGLGAFAAVLGLIFKNTILGLVAGVLFDSEHMMEIGDWITVPQYDIDGTVEEITLNTVKVRAFDNSLVTIPPFMLTNESFFNRNAMLRSGGRRIMRSINIDMTSVVFCGAEFVERLTHNSFTSSCATELLSGLQTDMASEKHVNSMTNLGLFRKYLVRYIESMPQLNRDMTYMVRTLEPGENGIPLQLYLFSSITEWVAFEKIQSELMDHVVAMAPLFELRIYQQLSDSVVVNVSDKTKA